MLYMRRFGASLITFFCLQFALFPAIASAQSEAEKAAPTDGRGVESSRPGATAQLSPTAQTPTPGQPAPAVVPGGAVQPTPPAPTWASEWGKPGWFNVGLTAALAAGATGINMGISPPKEPGWTGPILADRFMHDNLGATTEHGMKLAGQTSDILLYTLVGAPLLIEPALAWSKTDSPTAAGRLALINAQSLAVTFFATTAIKFSVGRQRPPLGACWDGPEADESCAERETLSFPSGHTSMAFAGAGLVCLNHEVLKPLGGTWDDIACYTALSAATATGVLRITANKHYMTDVLAGAAIGLAAGYFLPKWLYFGFDGKGGLLADRPDVMVSPSVGEMNGISVSFTW